MKWTCKKCGRETISNEKKDYCQNCQSSESQNKIKRQWERKIEKIEINLGTLKEFMNHHCYVSMNIYVNENYIEYLRYNPPIVDGRSIMCYNEGIRKHRFEIGKFQNEWSKKEYQLKCKGTIYEDCPFRPLECSAFLNKLFQWSKQENVKKIDSRYETTVKPHEHPTFETKEVTIEKKTPQEIQAEIEESKWKCSDCQRKIKAGDRYKETEGKYYCSSCSRRERERERERAESEFQMSQMWQINQFDWQMLHQTVRELPLKKSLI